MSHIRLASVLWIVALFTPLPAAQIVFLGGDGLSDGKSEIGPYEILIDGKPYEALCYDFDGPVVTGQQWDANLLTLDQWADGYFADVAGAEAKYGSAVWLLTRMLEVTKTSYRIGIQHAAWMLFSKVKYSDANRWLIAANESWAGGLDGVDTTGIRMVEAASGSDHVQGLMVAGYIAAPEPREGMLVGLTLLAGAILCRRRR
jgi:hypothetical protein